VKQRLSADSLPLPLGSSFDPTSVREVTLPTVGAAVEANFSYQSNRGELVFFAAQNEAYVVTFVNGGSPKADTDFTKMLDTLQPDLAAAPAS
jgi:hypothetical protein